MTCSSIEQKAPVVSLVVRSCAPFSTKNKGRRQGKIINCLMAALRPSRSQKTRASPSLRQTPSASTTFRAFSLPDANHLHGFFSSVMRDNKSFDPPGGWQRWVLVSRRAGGGLFHHVVVLQKLAGRDSNVP
jgi:hypothetical protein